MNGWRRNPCPQCGARVGIGEACAACAPATPKRAPQSWQHARRLATQRLLARFPQAMTALLRQHDQAIDSFPLVKAGKGPPRDAE
jgi:hypothetical protein